MKYINDGSPRNEANNRQDLESAFCYYYIQYILNKDVAPTNAFQKEIFSKLTIISPTILLPDYILRRNPGVSPIAQQKLFDYFSDNVERIEELIPVYPNDEKANDEYTKFVGRIGKTISDYSPSQNFSKAILLTNWMKGMPLSYLISSRYKYYQGEPEKYKNKRLPVVIRKVMDDVEKFVRFKFAKESSCYIDVLRYFFRITR